MQNPVFLRWFPRVQTAVFWAGSTWLVLLLLSVPPARAAPDRYAQFYPKPQACAPVLKTTDMSGARVINDCSDAKLVAMMKVPGKYVLNCGPRVDLGVELKMPKNGNFVIEGQDTVLDAGGKHRHFNHTRVGFRTSSSTLKLQNITLENGYAPRGEPHERKTGDSVDCAWGYKDGRGGSIWVKNGKLELVNVTFENNHAAPIGPDSGGGAVYAGSSLEVKGHNVKVLNNTGSNGGGFGFLQTGGVFSDIVFRGNHATGEAGNYVHQKPPGSKVCGMFNHDRQGGAGGNGAAFAVDGKSVPVFSVCGMVCEDNTAGSSGGCGFQTGNRGKNKKALKITDSIIQNNEAQNNAGGIRAQEVEFTMLRTVLRENTAHKLGGGVSVGWNGNIEAKTRLNWSDNLFLMNSAPRGGGMNGTVYGTLKNTRFIDNSILQEGNLRKGAQIFGGGFKMTNTVMIGGKDRACISPPHKLVSPFTISGSNNRQWPKGVLCGAGFRLDAKLAALLKPIPAEKPAEPVEQFTRAKALEFFCGELAQAYGTSLVGFDDGQYYTAEQHCKSPK